MVAMILLRMTTLLILFGIDGNGDDAGAVGDNIGIDGRRRRQARALPMMMTMMLMQDNRTLHRVYSDKRVHASVVARSRTRPNRTTTTRSNSSNRSSKRRSGDYCSWYGCCR